MKLGLIDVGGGLRGAYAIGILEYCLENNIKFDCCIGVSAGSSNLINFLAGHKKRNYRNYFDYAFRKEYSGLGCLIKKKNFLNFDYIYRELINSDGIDPLNYEEFKNNPADFFVVAEEGISGKTKYFTKDDIKKDDYRVLAASCNIPVINRPVEIDGVIYFDGGFADPIPIQKAIDEGCDKIILILTRLRDVPRSPKRDNFFAKFLKIKYPKAAEKLSKRAENYNKSLEYVNELEKEGKVLILSPKDVYGLDTLTKDKEAMTKLYEDGKTDAIKITEWLKNVKKEENFNK